MTMLLVLQTKQARNSTGALPTAKTMDVCTYSIIKLLLSL